MEQKLVKIKEAKKVIFVGDTHGDLKTSQKIIKKYLKPGNIIIFLGDYVDRGCFSKENLDFLLEQKERHSDQIILLQGNHEGYFTVRFSPAEFWENLSKKDYEKYTSIVAKLPLAAVAGPIIALHGALPDFERLEDFEKIEIGDENWFRICWGDFYEKEGKYLGNDPLSGRPMFGRNYFFEIMENIQKKILIRSHQFNAPLFMFDDKCLTIFTSVVYKSKKNVVIFDFEKDAETAKDLKILSI